MGLQGLFTVGKENVCHRRRRLPRQRCERSPHEHHRAVSSQSFIRNTNLWQSFRIIYDRTENLKEFVKLTFSENNQNFFQ